MGEVCKDYKEWVEEQVEKRVDDWVEKKKKKCKKRPWYDPRRWLCWLVTTLVKVVRWVVVTLGKWITYTVCETLALPANGAAWLIGQLGRIPILGPIIGFVLRLARWFVYAGFQIFWYAWGLADSFLSILGIKIHKRIGLNIIILRTKNGPICDPDDLEEQIRDTQKIFWDRAHIDVALEGIYVVDKPSPSYALTVPCGAGFLAGDLGLMGQYFEREANDKCFSSAFLRLVGIRSPLTGFIVQEVKDSSKGTDTSGCAAPLLTGYFVMQVPSKRSGSPRPSPTMAHEMGHCCGLKHEDSIVNLMYPSTTKSATGELRGSELWSFQTTVVRSSRFATYI